MKEEVTRIMRLVQEGKLGPEDAAELIEALTEARADGPDQPEEVGKRAEDPVSKIVSQIEKIGKDVAEGVDWKKVSEQIREGVSKGVEVIKNATEEARKSGKFNVIFGIAQSRTVELPIAVPEGKVLRIEGGSGDVRVNGGHDIGSLKVDATFRAHDVTEATRMASEYTPVIEEGEGFVLIKQPDTVNVHADVEVFVATGTPVEIKQASGDIRVTATGAAVRINGSSGDITVENAKGALDIATSSGDVRVSDAEAGLVTIEAKAGNVTLQRVSGNVNVRTSSGDVKLVECQSKSVGVEAASGDVSVDLMDQIDGTVTLRSVSGDVTVQIVDGADCRVSLSTLRGSVSTTLELQDMTKENMMVTGKLGAGTGLIEASAVNGDVHLSLRDSSMKPE